MFDKIKKLPRANFIRGFRDIRTMGLMVFGIIVLLVSWSGVKVIQSNYELQKKIARLEQENNVRELENNNLRLRNEYLNTDQFLELAARRQFGKAAPGEKLIIVPKEVALAHTTETHKLAPAEKLQTSATKSRYQRNFEAWMNFFLHRPQQIED